MKIDFKQYLEKFMHTKRLVIIILIGALLLVLPDLFPKTKSQTKIPATESGFSDRQLYEKELEKRLSHMLSTVRGISDVSVMVTVEDAGEMYYAKSESYDEKNADDGIVTEKNRQAESTPALKNESGGNQTPILLKTVTPKVSGVFITAKGADDTKLQADVIGAVRAVLNVAPHRVQVLCKS